MCYLRSLKCGILAATEVITVDLPTMITTTGPPTKHQDRDLDRDHQGTCSRRLRSRLCQHMAPMEEATLVIDSNTRHRTIHKARPEEGLACAAVEDISAMAKEAWERGATVEVGPSRCWGPLVALYRLTGT